MTAATDSRDAASASGMSRGLRNARPGDVVAIARIEKESFGDPWGTADFRALMDSPQTIFLVVTDPGSEEITGYAVALTVLDESEILNIAVDPAHRGRGLGGHLLDAALASLRELGAVATFLEVRESNKAARRLYGSRGFTEMSRRKGYYRSPVEDALVLRRAMQ
ncbi:MAG: ribosomal protein S18-alanine N-acetyltransferase [Gemmatimonadaceae bacterium]|nr:ribosomal protein S18-alanine N-acetyltransferase [Gemmatimonadaceae bacterium]